MSHPRFLVFLAFSLVLSPPLVSARAGVTLTSLNRYQWATTSIEPGVDGEFNQHTAPAGYDEWNDSISADSFEGSSSALATGMYTSPLVTPDSISVSLHGEATATCNDAANVYAQTIQNFTLEFDVTDAPAALILTSDKDTTFIGNGMGVANGRLELTMAPFTLLWDTGYACNDPFILEPGSYRLTINTFTEAIVDNQIGVSSMHHSTIDVDIVGGTPLVFDVDPLQSAIDLDFQVPGMPPQPETVHLAGTLTFVHTRCDLWGYESISMLEMDLHVQESQLVIETPTDPVTLTDVTLTSPVLGWGTGLTPGCCGLTEGCCTNLANYQIQSLSTLSSPQQSRQGSWELVNIAVTCIMQFFCMDPGGCDPNDDDPLLARQGTGFQSFDNMSFPGINIIDAPIDLGLGAMNPTATITGDIVGTLQPVVIACPADTDGSGAVGVTDFLAVLSKWGPCAACAEDIDNDGTVGVLDFLAVLANWGSCS